MQEHNEESIERLEELTYRISYDEDSKTKVIGFRPNGVAVIKSDFLADIIETMKSVNEGSFITLEELDKRSENW